MSNPEPSDRSVQTRPFTEKPSLKDYSNEELEKLIELKNQSLEKLQAHNLLPISNKNSQSVDSLPPPLPISNPNINSILSKYNIAPTLDSKKLNNSRELSFHDLVEPGLGSSNISFNQNNFTQHDSILKDSTSKRNISPGPGPLNSSLTVTQAKYDNIPNPYLNNLNAGNLETNRQLNSILKNTGSEKKHSQSFSWDGPRNSVDVIPTYNQSTPSKQLPTAPDTYRNSNKENFNNSLQLTPSTKAKSEASSAGK